jgi:pectin methylesterase-like acyl-CoA thioesterase
VQYSQNGYVYSLVASNAAGMATNGASLLVLMPPTISQQPTNLTVIVGTPVTFSVTASGNPAVSYQWNRNGRPIANANSPSYNIASPQGADNGALFSVTVNNSVANVTSSNAALTVLSTMSGAFLPTNNATGIAPDQQLRIVFPSAIKLGTNGVITVRDAADNSAVATIDRSQFLSYVPGNTSIQVIPNAAIRSVQGESFYYMPIAIYSNEVWITLSPTQRLSYGHTYYVNMEAGLLLDTNNAAIMGISGSIVWRFSAKASGPATPTASTGLTTITIGQDGTGDFASFQGAFDWVPQNNTLPRTIRVKPGIYRDSASLAQSRNFVTIVGDSASRTDAQLIYPFAYFAPPNTVFTAGSLRIESSNITVLNITLDNIIYNVYHPTGDPSSGAAGAFAGAINTLATTGKQIIFDNVLIKGGQDTIYNISGIVYYYNCEVWGSVDFIYGAALSVFDQCNIVEIRSTGGPCTAPNTAYAQPYGINFLNCTFPRALVANSYPYDVNTGSTTFQRPWGQDGDTAIINCAIGSQFSTMGYGTFGNTNEATCRAREYGTTLIGGGTASTIAQRQAAGAYWANTLDPDYTNNPSLLPTSSLIAPPTGTNNRVAVTINPNDYTLSAIFGNSYFNLNGWLPAVIPTITSQPTNQSASGGQPVSFAVSATGLPNPVYQWTLNNVNIPGATNAALIFPGVNVTNAGTYFVIISNSVGVMTSSNVVLSVANSAPSLVPVSAQTINAGVTLNITNVATDIDAPPQTLTFNLLTNPSGSTLDAAGVFTWRPSASQGGTTNPVSVKVTDNGTPNLSTTNNFNVIVNPVSKPGLGTISYSGTQLSITVSGGTVGPDYVVDASTNLTDWQTLLTTNLPPQPFTFADTTISTAPAKFYRVRLVP